MDLSAYEAVLYALEITDEVSGKFGVNMNDIDVHNFYQEAEGHRLLYYPDHWFSSGKSTDEIDIRIYWDGTVKDDRAVVNIGREFILY